MMKKLLAWRDRLMARAENAYCDMIALARKDEALGRKELDAHRDVSEKLGRHRVLVEVCQEINALLKSMGPMQGKEPSNADS